MELVQNVIALENPPLVGYNIRYVGNRGAGRSHNLAALTNYLRLRKIKKLDFNLDVVYISSCEILLQMNAVLVMRQSLIDAFPADKEHLLKCITWKNLVTFVHNKPFFFNLIYFR